VHFTAASNYTGAKIKSNLSCDLASYLFSKRNVFNSAPQRPQENVSTSGTLVLLKVVMNTPESFSLRSPSSTLGINLKKVRELCEQSR